jgi:Domain of unknown function (DUF4410)
MKTRRAGCIPSIELVAMAAMLLAMAACAPTNVEPVQTYQGARLPRPDTVIVTDFLATPADVTLDRGLGARLRAIASGASGPAQQSEDERAVTAAISKVLVEEIHKLGLPATQSNEPDAQAGTKLVVSGQILSIDEGNRTQRNLIGLGAGRSAVQAQAEAYYYTSGSQPVEVERFTADAESSSKPGAAETMGVGAVTGRVVESAAVDAGAGAALGGDVESDGDRLGKAIAKQLTKFFQDQGWVAAAAQ